MKLKRIDIKGFKSFADKLNLEFDNGITCIVGPNGSGKSNIADAIRWVLGEQSAKSLRGSKMEEVIFSGTDSRKPVGMAEVAMVIDNSEGKLNTEFSEVEIKRRVYRSGEGEYYINNAPCRLKDIYDLFYDTGIGREGYSIIGQGKIDEILNNKPTERRSFFEEATGISKYRIRLKDTERKLEEEQQNIIRINDIISELTNQIEPLHEQSEKAKKYLEIKEKLEEDEVNIYIYEYKKAKEQIDGIEEKKNAFEKEIGEQQRKVTNYKEEKSRLTNAHNELKNEIENEKNLFANIELENERRESEIKVIDEKVNNAKAYIKESTERKNTLLTNTQNKKSEHEGLLSEYNNLSANIDNKSILLASKQKHFDDLVIAISTKENNIENIKNDIASKINETYDIRAQIERLTLISETLSDKLKLLQDEIQYADRKASEIDSEMILQMKQITEYNEQKLKTQERIKDLLGKDEILKKDILEIQEKQQVLNKEINDKRSKYNIYVDMQNHHEGFNKTIKTVLNLKDSRNTNWNGICGVLGELIKVTPSYEVAIDVSLGARIQNIVVEKEETAKAVINYLKDNKEGRATFLPLSSVKSNTKSSVGKALLNETGVLGLAIDFVKFDNKYTEIIDSMLGKTIVIDNIDNAIAFSKKYNYTYKVVTIDGEIFYVGGAITGGSAAKDTANVFTRTREIGELKTSIESLESQVIFLHEKHKSLIEEKSKLENELMIKNKERETLELELVVIQNNYGQVEKIKNERLELNNKNIDEKATVEKQIIEVKEEIVYKEEEFRKNEISLENEKKEVESFNTSLDTERIVSKKVNDEITELKVELSALEQKKAMIEEEKSKFDGEIELINIEIKAIDNKLSSFKDMIDKSEDARIKLTQNIENEKLRLTELKVKLDSDELKITEFETTLTKCDEKIGEISIQVGIVQDKIYKLDGSSIEYKLKMENIEENLFEKYNLTYDEALLRETPKFSYNKAKDNIKNYKSQIEALGNVNIDAIEQYKTISERYNFLVSQRDDIVKAEEKLKEIIKELLEAMEKQFRYEFGEIDKNFSLIFKELFGGGSAKLKLVNEDDILESGIDIVVEPPGKKLQNIMLLSGGEKALTAISLLFAILKMRPSPFCVLDEIEAALDDANVDRYARYIKNYSDNTQFLVITHRKGTMEISDYLYGVTMEEKGVSKVISVKLEEAEEKLA